MEGRYKGPLGKKYPEVNGKPFKFSSLITTTFEKDKVVEIVVVWDAMSLMRQLFQERCL